MAALSPTPPTAALAGLRVVELGSRVAVGACGTLLAEAGADVVLVESAADRAAGAGKWAERALAAAGKSVLGGDADDRHEALAILIRDADVVLLSTDADGPWCHDARACTGNPGADRPTDSSPGQIVCDITAFGPRGGPADVHPAWSDLLVQAHSGLVDVTGLPDAPPVPIGLPFAELSAALYAASAVAAALVTRRQTGRGQAIAIALYDCAVNALATFLPLRYGGRDPRRVGNAHAMAAPWNAYRCTEGWILLCSATDDQWRRLCAVMERDDLAQAPQARTLADRLANRSAIDNHVQEWLAVRSVAEAARSLGAAGIACGPIVPVGALADEANLAHRRFVRRLHDPVTQREVAVATSPLHSAAALGGAPEAIPPTASDGAPPAAGTAPRRTTDASAAERSGPLRPPLDGIRVLEIGQYTTAPLAAKHLSALGAEVLKIEPPGGEASREWPPHQAGQGYFFTMNNAGKTSVVIDLENEGDRRVFRALLRDADVLVENTKPGSLARRGFAPDDLVALNPRLVYCAISGFGYDSAYPLRPAFDTVVQAMSGIMDLTRSGATPVKAGVSAADIIGGQFGLLAILLALLHREETRRGVFVDLAMQEASAWCTQHAWNRPARPQGAILAVADGRFVAAQTDEATAIAALGPHAQSLSIARALDRLGRAGIAAAAVRTVAELADDPATRARALVEHVRDAAGVEWPLLCSPLGLSLTPPGPGAPIGPLGSGNARLGAALRSASVARP